MACTPRKGAASQILLFAVAGGAVSPPVAPDLRCSLPRPERQFLKSATAASIVTSP
jgi:hypothetical protein